MTAKKKILARLKSGPATGKDLATMLGISRQALHKHLKNLLQNSEITKEGRTRGATYNLLSAKTKKSTHKSYSKIYALRSLQEDTVFQSFVAILGLNRNLSLNALDIVHYGFTEILNNAIEHSRSKKCNIQLDLDPYWLRFSIRDQGIGIFYSIYRKFNLENEDHAVLELLKGKTTTMPDSHAGEGVFFTSRAADWIFFRSHKSKLIFDNLNKDVFVEKTRFLKGTEVQFKIRRFSRKRLELIFEEFAPKEFEYLFEKTQVLVKLLNTKFVSRSEARRLLHGLEKFSHIVLDFKDVQTIGQGFADEIFRVFMKRFPEKSLQVQNLSPVLQPMIHHVVDKSTKNKLTIG